MNDIKFTDLEIETNPEKLVIKKEQVSKEWKNFVVDYKKDIANYNQECILDQRQVKIPRKS
jgi:hypothetical protein